MSLAAAGRRTIHANAEEKLRKQQDMSGTLMRSVITGGDDYQGQHMQIQNDEMERYGDLMANLTPRREALLSHYLTLNDPNHPMCQKQNQEALIRFLN